MDTQFSYISEKEGKSDFWILLKQEMLKRRGNENIEWWFLVQVFDWDNSKTLQKC